MAIPLRSSRPLLLAGSVALCVGTAFAGDVHRAVVTRTAPAYPELARRMHVGGKVVLRLDSLVERPAVYVGGFDEEFLAVPQECLVLTMQQNQKYFPLVGPAGKLLSNFMIVSNMRLDDPARNCQAESY